MAEDLLGPLRDRPLPPLASGATLRARGEQRRRRRRVALSSAVALTLVLAGGGALALSGRDEPDALRPAPFASPAPEPSDSPSPPPRAWFLPDAFLSAEEAARAEWPGWVVDEAAVPDNLTTVADPCRSGEIPLVDRVGDQGERVMGSTREAGGSSLLQEIYRYDSASDARKAFEEYEQQYARCASVPDPNVDGEGWTIRSEVRRAELTPLGASLLVRRIPCDPGGACTEHFSTYEMVAQRAEALTVVGYTIGEDGDPAEEAAALLDAVQSRLAQVVSG